MWVFRSAGCVPRASRQGAPTRRSGFSSEETQRRPDVYGACNTAKNPRVLGIVSRHNSCSTPTVHHPQDCTKITQSYPGGPTAHRPTTTRTANAIRVCLRRRHRDPGRLSSTPPKHQQNRSTKTFTRVLDAAVRRHNALFPKPASTKLIGGHDGKITNARNSPHQAMQCRHTYCPYSCSQTIIEQTNHSWEIAPECGVRSTAPSRSLAQRAGYPSVKLL